MTMGFVRIAGQTKKKARKKMNNDERSLMQMAALFFVWSEVARSDVVAVIASIVGSLCFCGLLFGWLIGLVKAWLKVKSND